MVILVVIIICTVLLLSGAFRSGTYMSVGASNPISQYKTIEDLRRNTSFDFIVPKLIVESEIEYLNNYMGQLVEIKTADIVFRATRFVDYNADISGDYNTYFIDNKYINSDGSVYVRYRSNNDSVIISIVYDGISYSIQKNAYITEDEAFKLIGIDRDGLMDFTEEHSDKIEDTDENSIASNDEVSGISNNEIIFKRFENSDMGVSFMVPGTTGEIMAVYTDNTLNLLLHNELLCIISYYSDGYNISEYTDYGLIEIDNNYLIRYVLKLSDKFDVGTVQYRDCMTFIDNIEVIKDTFKIQ